MLHRFSILFFSCLLLAWSAAGQASTTVAGRVSDAQGAPLAGVSVSVKGTSVGAMTNAQGEYSIVVPSGNATLVFAFLGMSSREEPVGGRSRIDLKLDELAQNLDDVVVTALGIRRDKKTLAYAATELKEDAFIVREANLTEGLVGKVAGVNVVKPATGASGSTRVTIRGNGSFGGNQPLYVVDGIPIMNPTYEQAGLWGGVDGGDGISSINSDDIESMSILKSGTAAALYGARAANGVIVISTKKGKQGKTRFNFSAKYGQAFVARVQSDYELVNLDKYKEIWSEGYVNSGEAANMAEGYALLKKNALEWYNTDIDAVQSVDWLDQVMRAGTIQEYNIDLQGGNESLRHYASFGYYENEGVLIGSGLKRYTGRLNLDGESGRIGYGISINAGLSDIDNIPNNSSYSHPIVMVYDMRPFQQPYEEDGSYGMYRDGFYNPVAIYDKEKGDIKNQKTITAVINPYFTYRISKDLLWKTNAGLSVIDINEFYFYGLYNPEYGADGMNGERVLSRANIYNITNTVNYNHSFGVHNVNAMIGQEAQKTAQTGIKAEATNYPSDVVIELINAATPRNAESTYRASTLASAFVNGEYNYDNKYYGSASFRYDASSRFGTNNRWAPFWSVGAKYRLSQEDFMENTRGWLTDLTVRGSYGTVGNQDIIRKYYPYMGLYEFGYSYNSNPGAIPTQIYSPDLKWETVKKADIGVNAVLFDRLSVELDFYNQRTSDMIFEVPLSYTTGFSNVMKNIGEMENRGVELLLNAAIVQTKDFSWNARFSGTVNRNKIVALATDKPIEGSWWIRQAGEAYHTFYLPVYAGVDAQTGEGLFYRRAGSDETTTHINEAEQQIVGSADPKFYGGVGTGVTFRGFDVSVDGSFSLGAKVFNRGLRFDLMCGHYELGPVAEYVYNNRWKNPGDETQVPKFVAGGNTDLGTASTRFLMNASCFRMKAINVGYTLPRMVARRLTVDNLRIFGTVDNLFTLTASDFIGFDPQATADGFQQWTYPIPTSVIFGVNVSF